MPVLTADESRKENLCLKKKQELLDEGVEKSLLKIRNFKENQEIPLEEKTEGEPDAWLESLNILLINARSLFNFERRFKFKNAVSSNENNVICVTENWLNDKMDIREVLRDSYTVFRWDRTMSWNPSAHGGVFVAVKNYIESNEFKVELHECCITCQIFLKSEPVQIMCFYNPPKYSSFRYSNENYTRLIGTFPGKTPTIICVDLNFPTANCTFLNSDDDEEQTFLDLVETNLYQQAVNFSTSATNILDVVFFNNCSVYACEDLTFSRIYNCTDHKPIKVTLEIVHKVPKVAIKNFHSFGSGNYEEMLIDMSINKFQPVCHTNINNTCL